MSYEGELKFTTAGDFMTYKKQIAIASDHAGYIAKDMVRDWLRERDYVTDDFGVLNNDSVDYPDYAKKVCLNILGKNSDVGILICGTGIGMSMVANRFPEIRAALCTDNYTAEMARLHNNANVLCLGARVLDPNNICSIVETFLNTEFEYNEKHLNRINKFSY